VRKLKLDSCKKKKTKTEQKFIATRNFLRIQFFKVQPNLLISTLSSSKLNLSLKGSWINYAICCVEKRLETGEYRDRADTTTSYLSDTNTITTDQLIDENGLESSQISDVSFSDSRNLDDTIISPFHVTNSNGSSESIHSAFQTTLLR